METINLLVHKYVCKEELSIKLLHYSPQSNEKTNVERKDGCIIYKSGFTIKLVWRNYPYFKRDQQKFCLFYKESDLFI